MSRTANQSPTHDIPEGNGTQFPPGWHWAKIGDLIKPGGIFNDGDWVETVDQDPNGGIRLIQLADVGDGVYRNRSSRFLTEKRAAELKCTFLKAGDVLIARMPEPLGRACIFPDGDQPSVTVVDVCVVRTGGGADHRWLMYFLNAPDFRVNIAALQSGSTRKRISRSNLATLLLPVPPLDEQKRIVAEIEKQFTRLDAGVASLKRVEIALKRYRASVLKAASEGRLNGENTLVTLTPLRDVITGLGQGWSPKCELNREALPSEWAIIKTTAVQSMKYLDCESKPLPETLRPRPAIEIKAGDFLMTRKGPRQRAGVTCLVRSTRQRLMVCDTVYRFRCLESRVIPAYLELALNSPDAVSEIDRRKSGINDSGVSLTHEKLGTVMVSIPSLPEQQRIVSVVERFFSVVEELETTVSANLKRAERLRQSILHRAFTGKL